MTIIYNNVQRISVARQNLYHKLIANYNFRPRIEISPENQLVRLPPKEIIWLSGLESEPFGTAGEKILTHHLNLLSRLTQEHDARTLDGSRVEIKCARYKISDPNKLNYCWTRINTPLIPTHNPGYDLLLLALLTEWGFKIRVLDQQQVKTLAQQIRQTRKLGNPNRITIWRDDLLFFLTNNKL